MSSSFDSNEDAAGSPCDQANNGESDKILNDGPHESDEHCSRADPNTYPSQTSPETNEILEGNQTNENPSVENSDENQNDEANEKPLDENSDGNQNDEANEKPLHENSDENQNDKASEKPLDEHLEENHNDEASEMLLDENSDENQNNEASEKPLDGNSDENQNDESNEKPLDENSEGNQNEVSNVKTSDKNEDSLNQQQPENSSGILHKDSPNAENDTDGNVKEQAVDEKSDFNPEQESRQNASQGNSQTNTDNHKNEEADGNPLSNQETNRSEQHQDGKLNDNLAESSGKSDNVSQSCLRENSDEKCKSPSPLSEIALDELLKSYNSSNGGPCNDGICDVPGAAAVSEEKSSEKKHLRLKIARNGTVTHEYVKKGELYGSDFTARYVYLGSPPKPMTPKYTHEKDLLKRAVQNPPETSASSRRYSPPKFDAYGRRNAGARISHGTNSRENPVESSLESESERTPLLSQPNTAAGDSRALDLWQYKCQFANLKYMTCEACHEDVYEKRISCIGVLCALACFPCGILCCYLLRKDVCPNCKDSKWFYAN